MNRLLLTGDVTSAAIAPLPAPAVMFAQRDGGILAGLPAVFFVSSASFDH